MPTVLYLSERETVDLFKVTRLEAHTGSVVAEAADAEPQAIAPGEALIDPTDPLKVTGPGRIKYWVEGEPYAAEEAGEPAPRGDAGDTTGSFEARTKKELAKLAKEHGISGASKMNKAQLIDALRAAR